MSEMRQFLNMKIEDFFIIQYPSGKFGYVGKVPNDLAFIDPTPEKLASLQYGERFGPKKRAFDSFENAYDFAINKGYKPKQKKG